MNQQQTTERLARLFSGDYSRAKVPPGQIAELLVRHGADPDALRFRRQAGRHADLSRHYERSARYPWLPVKRGQPR